MKVNIKDIIKNKKLIFIIVGVLLVVLIIVFSVWLGRTKNLSGAISEKNLKTVNKNLPTPEFLTEEEKARFGLPANTKAQSFRDSSGNLIYKIIKSDSDIIFDPSAVKPISPRQTSTPR